MSKMVHRTLDFLELFAAQRRPLSAAAIARFLGISPSSCHDVLETLRARGYLYEPAGRGGIYPTLRLNHIATTLVAHDPVVARTQDRLRDLRDGIDESVLLSIATGLQATYLLALQPSHPLRFLAEVGETLSSLHATSAGKSLLGSLSPAALSAFLNSATLTPFTPRTLVAKRALRKDIAEGNARGWFLNQEESQAGVTTVSARFRWGSVLYIATIAGPTSRMAAKLPGASERLTRLCRELEGSPADFPP
jgi:DNA-binding IclR family transcriptional regulator